MSYLFQFFNYYFLESLKGPLPDFKHTILHYMYRYPTHRHLLLYLKRFQSFNWIDFMTLKLKITMELNKFIDEY